MTAYRENPKRLKRIVVLLLSVMAISIIALLAIGLLGKNSVNPGSGGQEDTQTQDRQYSLAPYRDVAGLSVFYEDGSAAPFSALCKTPAVMVFWASWCPKCTIGFESTLKLSEPIKQQGATLYLVNKTDGTRETVQKANAYLDKHAADIQSLYDIELFAYQELGLSKIPTAVVIDAQGRVTGYTEGFVPDEDMLLAMVQEAKVGKAATVQRFITSSLLSDNGGLRTNYLDDPTAATPSGGDVLSESQGLMMLSAVMEDDRELFERLWGYAKNSEAGGGLTAWVTTDDGPSQVNAAIDDLRIYRALCAAQEQWGIGAEDVKTLAKGLYEYNTDGTNLFDFHDFSFGATAQRLTLCYADFEALSLLVESDGRWRTVYESCLELVQKGRISEQFPLYHSYYDYSLNQYQSDKLNMAEAMVTLLNLSRVGKLDAQSLQWLRDRLDEGAIYAQYSTDGRPTLEGRYESTAVYALCAMVAVSEGDLVMACKALSHLEALKIRSISSGLDGAFGNADGSGIYSFDQCTALLAYQQMERVLQ